MTSPSASSPAPSSSRPPSPGILETMFLFSVFHMFLSSNALMVKPNPLCPDLFRFGVSLAFKKLSFFGALDEIVNIVEYINIYIY